MALRNYIGGTVEDPCPTRGPVQWFGSEYCNANDYAAWRLRIKRMWEVGLEPTWNEYVRSGAAMMEGDEVSAQDPMWQRVERFRNGFNNLPAPSIWMGFEASSENVQTAIALGQDGEQTIELLRERIAEAGGDAPPIPAGPQAKMPGKSSLGPWLWGAAVGGAVVGTGALIAYYATRED